MVIVSIGTTNNPSTTHLKNVNALMLYPTSYFYLVILYPYVLFCSLNEYVFVDSALKIQCHIVKNTLLHITFSAIFPTGEKKKRVAEYIAFSIPFTILLVSSITKGKNL